MKIFLQITDLLLKGIFLAILSTFLNYALQFIPAINDYHRGLAVGFIATTIFWYIVFDHSKNASE